MKLSFELDTTKLRRRASTLAVKATRAAYSAAVRYDSKSNPRINIVEHAKENKS